MKDTMLYRSMALDRDLINIEDRTVELSFSSEMAVERGFWFSDDRYRRAKEILLHNEDNVDLNRIRNIGAVLFNHNMNNIVGPIREVGIKNRRGRAIIGFDDTQFGSEKMIQVKSGSLRGVSFGYNINRVMEVMPDDEFEGIKGPAMVGMKWTPLELTLTPMPADDTVGVGRCFRSQDKKYFFIEKYNKEERKIMDEEKKEKKDPSEFEVRFQAMEKLLKESEERLTAMISKTTSGASQKVRVVSDESFNNLLSRAQAVGVEVKAKIADMVLDGKTEIECERAITDALFSGFDAEDHGKKEKERPPKMDTVDDDDFCRALSDPVERAI